MVKRFLKRFARTETTYQLISYTENECTYSKRTTTRIPFYKPEYFDEIRHATRDVIYWRDIETGEYPPLLHP